MNLSEAIERIKRATDEDRTLDNFEDYEAVKMLLNSYRSVSEMARRMNVFDPSTQNLGTLIADERIYHIKGFAFLDGALMIRAQRTAEKDEEASRITEYVIFGPDGKLVCRNSHGYRKAPLGTPPVTANTSIEIIVSLMLHEQVGNS